jgi:hypothetical protein
MNSSIIDSNKSTGILCGGISIISCFSLPLIHNKPDCF